MYEVCKQDLTLNIFYAVFIYTLVLFWTTAQS